MKLPRRLARADRTVGLKVSKAEFTERFTREACLAAQLNHPNICRLYDVGPNYLVMELIDGVPLKGPLPVEKAVECAGQILVALDAAHRKNITHRDLKPARILVTKQGIKTLFSYVNRSEAVFSGVRYWPLVRLVSGCYRSDMQSLQATRHRQSFLPKPSPGLA